jgi:homoserine acetyltransferase
MRTFPADSHQEFKIFKKLDSPLKIQDFLDTFAINFEQQGDTCLSPLLVLQNKQAHCIEGALVAAAALWYHGKKPLLMDLKTAKDDFDHVVALFKQDGAWGAISKTNHAVLRYRDPVYKTARELAMSYFNEYFLDNGAKTLRSFSAPFSLLGFEDDWLTSPHHLWGVANELDAAPHHVIARQAALQCFRPADPIEIQAGKLLEWENQHNKPVTRATLLRNLRQ